MFVETKRRGSTTEVLACSEDIEKLQKKMRNDIKEFVEEVYGEDWKEECSWLRDPEEVRYFWSDNDEEYETVFQINSVQKI